MADLSGVPGFQRVYDFVLFGVKCATLVFLFVAGFSAISPVLAAPQGERQIEGQGRRGKSDLESAFEAGRFDEFFALARPRAEKGDVEALFLLGKAYHLGKGVEPNRNEAWRFYDAAAQSGDPRAVHNMGSILVDEGYPDSALAYFRKALDSGLKMPSLYNIGRVLQSSCEKEQKSATCSSAGDAYIAAWNETNDIKMIDRAVRGLANACMIQRRLSGNADGNPEECAKAAEWAERGSRLGSGVSAYNRGALELDAGRYADAIPWFRLAYERGLPLAAFTLGEMSEVGKGGPRDRELALEWFKKGAELNDEKSSARVREYLGSSPSSPALFLRMPRPAGSEPFNLRLADMCGTGGKPYEHTPWMIVRSASEPEGMRAVSEEDVVLRGETDARAEFALSREDNEAFANAWRAEPDQLWLLYPGQSVRLIVSTKTRLDSGDCE